MFVSKCIYRSLKKLNKLYLVTGLVVYWRIFICHGLSDLSNTLLLEMILCGDGKLSVDSNSGILKATLR